MRQKWIGECTSWDPRMAFGRYREVPWLKTYECWADDYDGAAASLNRMARADGYGLGGVQNIRPLGIMQGDKCLGHPVEPPRAWLILPGEEIGTDVKTVQLAQAAAVRWLIEHHGFGQFAVEQTGNIWRLSVTHADDVVFVVRQ